MITQPEQLQKLSDNVREANGYFGILYPRTDMNDLLVDDPYLSSYNESLPFAQSWYMVKGWDVKQAFKEVLEQPSVNASNLASLENKIRELQVLKGILE